MTMKNLGYGFRSLRHPDFRLFWFGQGISVIGTWMQTVAQSWLVLQITGSAVDLGIVTALQTLPVLLISPFGGVFADRLRKRDVLVCTQTAQMILAFVLGVLVSTHMVQIWHVYLLAGLLGLANSIDMPTRQSFIVEMVGPEDLMNGIAHQSMLFNAARIIGPATAGLMIARIGTAGSFYANGVSFIPVILAYVAMRPERFYAVAKSKHASVLESLREGGSYIRRSPAILLIVFLVGSLGLFNSNVNVIVPLFAKNVLNVGPEGFGALMALMGVGALGGAMVTAFAQRSRWKVLFISAAAFFVVQLVFAFSRSYPLSLAMMALSGFTLILFLTCANTGVQQQIDDRLRGRVMGVYMAVNVGGSPIGNLFTGWVAAGLGAPAALTVDCGVALLILLGAGTWMLGHRESQALRLHATPGFAAIEPTLDLVEASD